MLPFENQDREVVVKIDASTSDKFGKLPGKRTIKELLDFGIVNLDKPAGPTSHEVTAHVQKALHIKKAGHSGTLDPAVTGCLPIALGKGTKIVQLLLTAGKEYVCLMRLHKDVSQLRIREVIGTFQGEIDQMPPVRSSVKRELRKRTIYAIKINEIDGRDVLMTVACQAGTYIRKLCSDIGLQVGGAHMAELRRTKAGPFNESSLVTLHDLVDAFHYWKKDGNENYIRSLIQPFETGCLHLPKIWVLDTTVDSLAHGARLNIPGIAKFEKCIEQNDRVAVLTLKGELVCYGTSRLSAEQLAGKERGPAVTTLRVFMEPGVYPKIQRNVKSEK